MGLLAWSRIHTTDSSGSQAFGLTTRTASLMLLGLQPVGGGSWDFSVSVSVSVPPALLPQYIYTHTHVYSSLPLSAILLSKVIITTVNHSPEADGPPSDPQEEGQ